MNANKALAERARQLADHAPAGSPDRKAYGCAAVALSTTATAAAARKVLATDCPDVARAAALAALDQLTTEE